MGLSRKYSVFKHILSFRSWFLKMNTYVDANFLLLDICYATGFQWSHNTLKTNTLTQWVYKNTTLCYTDSRLINS